MRRSIPFFAFGALLLAAACSPVMPVTPAAVSNAVPDAPSAAATAVVPTEAAALPAWQTIRLTDARTGAAFTLADFAGRTVYVEPMATWCSNCRAQQNIVRDVRAALGDDAHVYLSLSVETNITGSDLAAYAERNSYGWRFAVATPEMLSALVNQFGRTVSNPPATPHFIIYPDGTFSNLESGRRHSADELVAALTRAGA